MCLTSYHLISFQRSVLYGFELHLISDPICNALVSSQDGTANYLKGLMLILCYLIVAASFFVHVDPQSSE
jgi:Ca2+/H+ antiporter